MHNKDITIYGTGEQTRSFCYVDDLVDGMVKMMEQDGFIGPVNLGNPHEMSILELATMIIEKTGSSSKLMFKELPEDDPVKRKPDISLANQKLNWNPVTDVSVGLDKTIDYFRKKY